MDCLADTGAVLRAVNPLEPRRSEVLLAMGILRSRGMRVCVVPQVAYELWAVATRPKDANGLGLSPSGAMQLVERTVQELVLLRDLPELFDEWLLLVRTHGVSGKKAHDARLVAAMRLHGISSVLTYNGQDFRRYPGSQCSIPPRCRS